MSQPTLSGSTTLAQLLAGLYIYGGDLGTPPGVFTWLGPESFTVTFPTATDPGGLSSMITVRFERRALAPAVILLAP